MTDGCKEERPQGQKGRQEDQDHEEGFEDGEEACEAQGCKEASETGSRQEAREKGGASLHGETRGGSQSRRAEGRSAGRSTVHAGRRPDLEPRPRRRRGVTAPPLLAPREFRRASPDGRPHL